MDYRAVFYRAAYAGPPLLAVISLDEMVVGWRAVDHEGEILDMLVQKQQ